MQNILNRDKALVFRIVHRDSFPWILDNGLHCRNSNKIDPEFVNIGNPDLIDKRHTRVVNMAPGGTLSDYVPFYFTPYSPMLYNINTGYNGIRRRANEEIIIIVSSLHLMKSHGVAFLFTDRHAYLQAAQFSSDLADLDRIDWKILQNRDFKRDNDDLGKLERYQAEALAYKHLPVASIAGVACCNDAMVDVVNKLLKNRNMELKVASRREWYF